MALVMARASGWVMVTERLTDALMSELLPSMEEPSDIISSVHDMTAKAVAKSHSLRTVIMISYTFNYISTLNILTLQFRI